METNKNIKDYIEWLKDKGKAIYELSDIYINKEGILRKEKKMVWRIESTTEDYDEFCKETSKNTQV